MLSRRRIFPVLMLSLLVGLASSAGAAGGESLGAKASEELNAAVAGSGMELLYHKEAFMGVEGEKLHKMGSTIFTSAGKSAGVLAMAAGVTPYLAVGAWSVDNASFGTGFSKTAPFYLLAGAASFYIGGEAVVKTSNLEDQKLYVLNQDEASQTAKKVADSYAKILSLSDKQREKLDYSLRMRLSTGKPGEKINLLETIRGFKGAGAPVFSAAQRKKLELLQNVVDRESVSRLVPLTERERIRFLKESNELLGYLLRSGGVKRPEAVADLKSQMAQNNAILAKIGAMNDLHEGEDGGGSKEAEAAQ